MSKRSSRDVKTSLLGGAGLAAMFVLTGCEEEKVETHAYESVAECSAGGVYTAEFCEENFEEAVALHRSLAPRYEDIEDCEKDFGEGRCEADPQVVVNNDGGSNSFLPFMLGYMMANNTTAGASYSSSPVYRTADNKAVGLSGRTVPSAAFSSAGASVSPATVAKPNTRTTFTKGTSVSTRGGFGSTGRGLSMGS